MIKRQYLVKNENNSLFSVHRKSEAAMKAKDKLEKKFKENFWVELEERFDNVTINYTVFWKN